MMRRSKALWTSLCSLMVASPALATEAHDIHWSYDAIHLREAWALLGERGLQPGEGVLVAHPDTGVSPHPELARTRIRWDLAWDFVGEDSDPTQEPPPGRFPRHSHGTETLSIMASASGCDTDNFQGPCLWGIAPAAHYIPLRVSDSPILDSGERLARAIDHAVASRANVISISVGGSFPMEELHESVRKAHQAGLIVIASAGNATDSAVVAPAVFEETIAVAAVDEQLQPWNRTVPGTRVDWSAPGVNVAAAFTMFEKGDALRHRVYGASGTSDAAAVTSGIAALWLAYHKKELQSYAKADIPEIFRRQVTLAGVNRPPHFPEGQMGSGIIDAEMLLKAPLPSPGY